MHSLIATIENFAASPYALWILAVLSFAESSFFPIPPDVLMIPLALANPGLSLFYALVTTVTSVLGGMFGYAIGDRGGKPILYRLIKPERVEIVKILYNRYDIWAVTIAALTPIPYKVFTISAGVFDLDFKRFVLASLVGRGGRFFLVGGLIFVFGQAIKNFLDSYFELAVITFTILLVGGFWVFGQISNRLAKKEAGKKA